MITRAARCEAIGLMLSGGLDSAILLAHLLEQDRRVQPFYVSTGCVWEAAERAAVGRYLAQLDDPAVAPLIDFSIPAAELYGEHWSLTGENVPDESTPDEAVELPGRNPLLLLQPMLWCGQHGVAQLAMATLSCNPFADATPEFFDQFGRAVALGTGASVEVVRPFEDMTKADVLALAVDLPLHLTFSCLAPRGGLHCGRCNKCAERARALRSLPTGDPTNYASNFAATTS